MEFFRKIFQEADFSGCISMNKNKSVKDVMVSLHPSQLIDNEIRVEAWEVSYSYTTQRDNKREGIKVLFAPLDETEAKFKFIEWLNKFNKENPHRALLNVEILKMSYVGEIIVPLK